MSSREPADFALERLKNHTAYVPGEQPSDFQEFVKLNTNENPYPPSPRIEKAILDEIPKLQRYPNPPSSMLRETIAQLHGIMPSQVIVGNGSDELLTLCVRCFANSKRPIGITSPSYSLYENLASLQGASLMEVPFESDFALDPSRIGSCPANLFFLTTPNAPSGIGYRNAELAETLTRFPGILVADEAYADFANENAVSLLSENKRLVITRTLSKSYGLAGLRLGYALGSSETIQLLDKAREVYNVDRLAQAAALAALEDQDYFQRMRQKVILSRQSFSAWLKERGWNTYESQANFVFTEPRSSSGSTGPIIAEQVFQYLFKRKVLIRRFEKHALTSGRLRISIGTEDEMELVSKLIQEWMRTEQAE